MPGWQRGLPDFRVRERTVRRWLARLRRLRALRWQGLRRCVQPVPAGRSECPPDDPNCAETSVLKYCDASGQCGSAYPVCGNACDLNTDCPAIEVCKPCADGTCATVTCQNGQCGWECPAPTNPECTVPTDCAAIEICNVCADGSCAQIDCVNGACQFVCQ
jgi:hypothetical protein